VQLGLVCIFVSIGRSHFKSTKTLEVSFRTVLAEGTENVRLEWVTLGTQVSLIAAERIDGVILLQRSSEFPGQGCVD
jgi:hypothetical protein